MTAKESGPEIPSPQDLAAFAKEYYKSYMEAVEEKKPLNTPQFAQDGPYSIRSYLLPNGCICMIFNTAKELQVEGAHKDWDEVQDQVVKGVDHFAGFYPFEGRSLGDWNKRGKRDALRDLRLLDRSALVKAGAELESVMDNVAKMVNLNPWLNKDTYKGAETIDGLRKLEGRLKGGFPTVDAIASLQSLKTYTSGTGTVTIDFPEKELLEQISDGIKDLASVEGKLETFENRMFEIEKLAAGPESSGKMVDLGERVDRIEKHLEKVSNILTMLNSKVESYFTKTAERERQADLERRIEDQTGRTLSLEGKLTELEKQDERVMDELRKVTAKIDKDIHDSRKRIARMEKHMVDFAKLVQE